MSQPFQTMNFEEESEEESEVETGLEANRESESPALFFGSNSDLEDSIPSSPSSRNDTTIPSTPFTQATPLFDAFTPRRSDLLSPISLHSALPSGRDHQQREEESESELEDEEDHLRRLQQRKRKLLDNLHSPSKKSTKNIYSRCQDDYQKWCKHEKVSELVDETKMLLFLDSQHRRTHKRNSEKIVGHQVLRQYCTALVKLWETQRRQGLTLSANPRTSNVQNWLRSTALEEQSRKRLNFEDRASQLHLESTITVKEREALSLYFLRKKSKKKITFSLGMRFAWLGAFSQLLRGESIRMLEFSDLLMKDYEPMVNGKQGSSHRRRTVESSDESEQSEEESNSTIKMLICILGSGKTHSAGQSQYGASYRHSDALLCPIGSLALYFFSRFQVDEEGEDSFPDLTEPKEFFNVKVVRAQPNYNESIDQEKAMSYKSHYRAFKRAYSSTGIDSSKATHLCRSGAASTVAQNEAVSHEDVRLAGRWDYSVMVKAYLHKLPHPVLRSLAGFKAEIGSECSWNRDVKPPRELLEKVYPFLNRYRIGGSEDEDGEEEEQEESEEEEQSESDFDSEDDQSQDERNRRRANRRRRPRPITLTNQTSIRLLKLLHHLRVILLQDAAILKDRFPDIPLLQHELFESDSFIRFQERVVRAHHREPRIEPDAQVGNQELANLVQQVIEMREIAQQHEEDQIERHTSLIKALKRKGRSRESQDVDLLPSSVDISPLNKPTLANIKSVPELWKIWTKGSLGKSSVEELDSKNQGRISWMKDGYGSGKEKVSGKTWRRRYSRAKEIITPMKERVEESLEKRRSVVKRMENVRGDWSLDRLSKSLALLRRRNQEFGWTRSQLEQAERAG